MEFSPQGAEMLLQKCLAKVSELFQWRAASSGCKEVSLQAGAANPPLRQPVLEAAGTSLSSTCYHLLSWEELTLHGAF